MTGEPGAEPSYTWLAHPLLQSSPSPCSSFFWPADGPSGSSLQDQPSIHRKAACLARTSGEPMAFRAISKFQGTTLHRKDIKLKLYFDSSSNTDASQSIGFLGLSLHFSSSIFKCKDSWWGHPLSFQQLSVAELVSWGLRRRIWGPSEPFCLYHHASALPALPQELS